VRNGQIIEKVRRIRQEHSAQFDYDMRAMVADLRRREQESPGRIVDFPAKRIEGG
jgi:hypothetical protein